MVKELDQAIERISQVQPNLQESLFETYFRNAGDALGLSEKQKEVLAGMDEVFSLIYFVRVHPAAFTIAVAVILILLTTI